MTRRRGLWDHEEPSEPAEGPGSSGAPRSLGPDGATADSGRPEGVEPADVQPAPLQRSSVVAWSLGGLLVLVVVIAALLLDPGPQVTGGSEVLAWEACRGEVLGRLREPDSAVFPPASEATIEDRDPVWTVAAHVDARNTFGELVRERYVCTVEFGASGARLVEMQLTPVPDG